jgi:tetratricopeptide (TPR) repeat protein
MVNYKEHSGRYKNPMKPPRQAWLIGPLTDISFFIAAPLAIVPAFQLLLGLLPFDTLKLAILSVSATGHHLPGFIRAYTDKGIFERFRYRLLIVPPLLILMAAAAAYFKLTLVFFILIAWSTWHGAMQILGFLRIYDAKAGLLSRTTARLDFWMCLCWFLQVVLWSAPKKTSLLGSFYAAGGPLLPFRAAHAFEWAWLAFTALVTAAFLVNAAADWRRHGYVNGRKLLCMASSFGFWGYCMIGVNNLILGLILWEIFHDLQYNVFVWDYNRKRVDRGLSRSPFEGFLFRRDPGNIALYALCIVAYGALGLLSQDTINAYQNGKTYATALAQFGNIFAASAMIHFYLDGFIWKVRDGKVQRDLGLPAHPESSAQAGSAAREGFADRPKAMHASLVALFCLAAAALGISEYRQWNAPASDQADNLARLVPASGYANFVKATFLQQEGKGDSAIAYYQRAIAADSNYGAARVFIADLKAAAGDLEGAIADFETAEAQDPQDMEVRDNLAQLYLRTGRYAQARGEYARLSDSDPSNPAYAYQLAWSLLQMKRGQEAKPYLEKTLALDPVQPRALNYLGMVEQAAGNLDRARELFLKALDLDSAYAHARENLKALPP